MGVGYVQARAVFGGRPSAIVDPVAAPTPPNVAKCVLIEIREAVAVASLSRLAAETVNAAAGGADEIVWLLTSPGGELLPTLELCRTMAKFPVKLKTFALGQVASAAHYLMLAGAERIAHPEATFLFHEVSVPFKPPPGTFVARSVERHRQLFELTGHEVYRASTRLPLDMIARFARETIILDAKQALEFGVVHRIAESFHRIADSFNQIAESIAEAPGQGTLLNLARA